MSYWVRNCIKTLLWFTTNNLSQISLQYYFGNLHWPRKV